MSERDIIDRWGTSEQYHEELRTFMEQHKNAPIIVVSTKHNAPIAAVYYFRPMTVYKDHLDLIAAIRESIDMEKDYDTDS